MLVTFKLYFEWLNSPLSNELVKSLRVNVTNISATFDITLFEGESDHYTLTLYKILPFPLDQGSRI